MTASFLDRLGDQLAAAERALTPSAATKRRTHRWAPPKSAILLLAGLAVAVPAVAATQPWRPILGRPTLRDTPVSTSGSAVPANAIALLAVLRRPQTDRDRGRAIRTLLRSVGQQFSGVRLISVRLLSPAPGHHALVMSATGVGQVPAIAHHGVVDPVCLIINAGSVCGDARSLRTTGVVMTAGSSVRGLVPDGVAKVVLTFDDGRTASDDVRDNLFWITHVPTARRTLSEPTAKRPRPKLLTTAPFTTRWLDSEGTTIGPQKPK